MKKVLILQIINHGNGGIRNVNKSISDELVKLNFEVRICSIRDSFREVYGINENVKMDIINSVDSWEIVHRRDVINSLKENRLIEGMKKFFQYIKDYNKLCKDYKKLKKYIMEYNPDYIIASHYQVLCGIPKHYLNKVINIHHTSYMMLSEFVDNRKKLCKLNNKIKFVWLTKKSCDMAVSDGFKNCYYIYNPIRFKSLKCSNVVNNKKLITIARISPEKRIDLMIDIVKDVFKDKKYKDWKFEIYGYGDQEDFIKEKIEDNKQIFFRGVSHDPKSALLTSSINLNTSRFEGFSMSTIEALECGIPTISFNVGESVDEQIINGKTGYILEQGDIEGYKNKLKLLMDNSDLLNEMSKNSKEFAKNFSLEKNIKNWIKIFEDIDNNIRF